MECNGMRLKVGWSGRHTYPMSLTRQPSVFVDDGHSARAALAPARARGRELRQWLVTARLREGARVIDRCDLDGAFGGASRCGAARAHPARRRRGEGRRGRGRVAQDANDVRIKVIGERSSMPDHIMTLHYVTVHDTLQRQYIR
jgi:hypothetical protein